MTHHAGKQLTPNGVGISNPAFDVTPAKYIARSPSAGLCAHRIPNRSKRWCWSARPQPREPLRQRPHFARCAARRRNVATLRVVHHHAVGVESPSKRPDRPDKRFRHRWNRILVVPGCALLLSLVVPAVALAQQQIELVSAAGDALPDAPLPQTEMQQSAKQARPTEGNASIAGIVQDTTGAFVAGAQVSLTQRDGRNLHTVVSGANGDFAFTKLSAGSYLVMVNAKGFAQSTSEEITLSPLQSFIIPKITSQRWREYHRSHSSPHRSHCCRANQTGGNAAGFCHNSQLLCQLRARCCPDDIETKAVSRDARHIRLDLIYRHQRSGRCRTGEQLLQRIRARGCGLRQALGSAVCGRPFERLFSSLRLCIPVFIRTRDTSTRERGPASLVFSMRLAARLSPVATAERRCPTTHISWERCVLARSRTHITPVRIEAQALCSSMPVLGSQEGQAQRSCKSSLERGSQRMRGKQFHTAPRRRPLPKPLGLVRAGE